MAYFTMCIDLKGRTILLVGDGPQTADKMRKLRLFGCELRQASQFCPACLTKDEAFVVVGDTDRAEAARIVGVCREYGIPVNVVDAPELCSFFFPATVIRGNLTVAVSTAGKAPGAAAFLAGRIGAQLPDRTEEILDWLGEVRQNLYARWPKDTARQMLSGITREALERGYPLTDEEIEGLTASGHHGTGNL